MRGLPYQLKSVLRDKFCLMTFLLPILAAAALNLMGAIDLSSLGQLHFGVLEDGVALVNGVLPMTPGQYILQKAAIGFLFGSLSSMVTACICFRLSWQNAGVTLALILLSSFVAALIGLFIGRLSDGLMVGVVYIKIIMLVFIAVPILCALIGVSGPMAVICNIIPSQPAFEGIMAMSAGNMGTAWADTGVLALHAAAWFALYALLSRRRRA